MSEENTISEMTQKMENMNKILESNLFNNPIREVNDNFRKDLLEFKEIFLENLRHLENILVSLLFFLKAF